MRKRRLEKRPGARAAVTGVAALAIVVALAALSGCVQKMGKLGHLHPYEMPRLPVEGTIARGHLPSPLDDPSLKKIPLTVNAALLKRGQERFNIYCAPCHGYSGYGDGMVVQRGFITPPSYHSPRVREATDGHIYDVINRGFGGMYGYGDRVDVRDRWAIVAYVRALELSQDFPASRLTAEERGKLESPGKSSADKTPPDKTPKEPR